MKKFVRTWAERLSRGRSIRRHLPKEFGSRPLHLSPDSALTYLKPNWADASEGLLSAVRKYVKPGDNVWDIGSNVGVFMTAAAHRAGPGTEIVAVEADPFLASLLQKTVLESANADCNMNVICAAVSDQQGLAKFLVANRGRSSNSLAQSGHRTQAGGTRYAQYVPTLTLDMLLESFQKPQMIKIDVEGAETMVLQGAKKILRECRPVIYLEVGFYQNDVVTTILKEHDYRLYDGDTSDGVELSKCVVNTLAVPAENSLTNR